ncbi:MAG: hypothetical protein H6858_00865 [Rhodospirillales bacterium]|nr:hypothetical protein [Alphaproteobacteria bacterium]MCB1838780.1 hypothetical protein [Alphaproteobacteria bacterium]MCB9976131.1 hypothetical protein [Rhodospirillales bacterium]
MSAAWKAVRTIAPILAVSTVIAAATGGLSIPLTAGAVSAAGTSVATTSAVHVTAANMASFTLQGLVHNFHGLADGVTWLANHIPAVG